MREVERICDQVILMRSGKNVSQGSPLEVIQTTQNLIGGSVFKGYEVMMNSRRIKGLFMRHFYLIKSSIPRIIDLIYWLQYKSYYGDLFQSFFHLMQQILIMELV